MLLVLSSGDGNDGYRLVINPEIKDNMARTKCYFDISIGGKAVGRIVFEVSALGSTFNTVLYRFGTPIVAMLADEAGEAINPYEGLRQDRRFHIAKR